MRGRNKNLEIGRDMGWEGGDGVRSHNVCDEIINERPGRKYIIGTLAAKKEKELPLRDEEEGRASIRAQRLKVSFLRLSDKHVISSILHHFSLLCSHSVSDSIAQFFV